MTLGASTLITKSVETTQPQPRVNQMTDAEQKIDVYQRITNEIVAMLETGVQPWARGYIAANGGNQLRENGQPYQGINQLYLGLVAAVKGHASPYWLTFQAAKKLGGNVRKGEKGTVAVYYGTAETKASKERREGEEADYFTFAKAYTVFNASQCDGLPSRFFPAAVAPRGQTWNDCADIEAIFAATRVTIKHSDAAMPHYSPALDRVVMPSKSAWHDATRYYSTLSYEVTHATAHKSRCDRDVTKYHLDVTARAFEELVAELGAAFMCNQLGLANTPREDHAAYIGSWLKALRGDKRFIFKASSAAQKAVNWIMAQSQPATLAQAAE